MATRMNLPGNLGGGSEALQLAAVRLNTMVKDGKGGRIRPVMCMLVGGQSTFCFGMEMVKSGDEAFDAAGRVLAKTLGTLGQRAGVRVQVRDAELATSLRRRIELGKVEFEVVD